MEFEKLSEDMQKLVQDVRHYAASIDNDVKDALEEATDEADFKSMVVSYMDDRYEEIKDVWQRCGGG